MKHRSVSKVRSAKTAKKTRFVSRQESNAKHKSTHPIKQVWVSNVFIASHTDINNINIPARIMRGNGTYCRAKHDITIRGKDGFPTVKRYIAN